MGAQGQAGPLFTPQGHSRPLLLSRCYILENDTVQCDLDLYKSLQAWKDHKLHIDHEVRPLGGSTVWCHRLWGSIHQEGRETGRGKKSGPHPRTHDPRTGI